MFMDPGGATDRAKRTIGSQISRALLASAIEIKKKAALDIEGKVKLCLQRDERTAHNAIDIIIQTLEQEFLGIRRCASESKYEKIAELSSSHLIGGMLGLVGVVRGSPLLSDRILDSLYFIHAESEDVSCLYYSSECIFNVILCSRQNELNLDFNLLFKVLRKLCLHQNSQPKTKDASSSPDVLTHAMLWIDRSVREIAIKQGIDVRELILKDDFLWRHLDPQWLDIVVKNNRDNGIRHLAKLLDIFYHFSLRDAEKIPKHCLELGMTLAQELMISKNHGDSACEEIIGFWLKHQDDHKGRCRIVQDLLLGLENLEGKRSMTSYTCYILVCDQYLKENDGDAHVCAQWPIAYWFELLDKYSDIQLSEAAWCAITAQFKDWGVICTAYLNRLAEFLIRNTNSNDLIGNINGSAWIKECEAPFWAAVASNLNCANLSQCVELMCRIRGDWKIIDKLDGIVKNVTTPELPTELLTFFLTLRLSVQSWADFQSWQMSYRQIARINSKNYDYHMTFPNIFAAFYREPVEPSVIKLVGSTAHDVISWLEVIVLALEWPECVSLRLKCADTEFYRFVWSALPLMSSARDVARQRLIPGPITETTFHLSLAGSTDTSEIGHKSRMEVLKQMRDPNKTLDRLVTLPIAPIIVPMMHEASTDSEIVKEQTLTPKTQIIQPVAHVIPNIKSATDMMSVLETSDATQSTPVVGDADIDSVKAKEVDQHMEKNSGDLSGNRTITFDNEEHIY